MTDMTKVGVSPETYERLRGSLASHAQLVPIDRDADSDIAVLWRRQCDRTAWVVGAVSTLPGLRWIHTDTAGVDRLPLGVLADRGILLSNARDAHSPAVSEWALGAILLAAKSLPQTVRDSDRRVWNPHTTDVQLRGKNIAILGLGSIGTALARACAALGMRVVGISRSGTPVSGVAQTLRTTDGWADALSTATFVVNCLPLTPETEGLINSGVLKAMPKGAWFINVGRGETVNELQLVAAVRSGKIGGAVVDTVANEPLTSSSALWNCPNVIVSPHVSSFTDQTEARTREVFLRELERYRNGNDPQSLIDLVKGY